MACVAVVLLNRDGVRLPNDVSFVGEHGCECIPVLRGKETVLQVLDLIVESPECCSITIADNPGDGSACSTIHGFDDPLFVCFDPTKCHISSNSISWIVLAISGSGSLSASRSSHFCTAAGVTSNSLARKPYDAFPNEYKRTANARLIAVSCLTRPSPATKLQPQFLHRYLCFPRTFPFLTMSV